MKLLVCAATEFECDLVRARFDGRSNLRIIATGVGCVNAAHATTVAVLAERPDALLICGVGGAYPSSGLKIADVVCADLEVYGDLGAQSPNGFLDMKALGFPVIAGTKPLYNEMPLQIFPASRQARFVTVSTCTGTHAAALDVEQRTGGAVENMEGAAIVHVANMHGIAVGEVRGISNIVTDRDPASWRLQEAAAAAQEAVLAWLARR